MSSIAATSLRGIVGHRDAAGPRHSPTGNHLVTNATGVTGTLTTPDGST